MRVLRSLLLLALASTVCLAAPKKPYPLRDAVECTPRGGIPNFLAKAEAGKDLKIAYLGGSITAQNGWRPKTLKWFQDRFPKAKIEQIHAAIGGTGSDLGVFRLRKDVLDKKPDLMFVEFAVNDGGASPDRITKSMEGIVRQAWKADPTLDICFVYTATIGMLKDLQSGKFPRAASVMENIADHYNIPSIHMCLKVAQMEKEGKVIFKATKSTAERKAAMEKGTYYFSRDGVHPYEDSGHILYLEAVARSMPAIFARGKVGPHALPAPIDPNNWEDASMVPFGDAKLSPDWKLLDPVTNSLAKRFRNNLPQLWMAETPGASATFKIKGSMARVFDLVGPTCGRLKITVDGKDKGMRNRFDAYCTYYRLQQLGLADGLDPNQVHTIKVEISAEQPEKRKILKGRSGPNAKILALDDAAFAKKFDGCQWYAGYIMYIGQFIKE
jgi:lysophospholipase L1-like esterase